MKLRRLPVLLSSIGLAAVVTLATPSFAAAASSSSCSAGGSYLVSSNQNCAELSSAPLFGWLPGSGLGTPVPEPSAWAMLGLGTLLIGAGVYARRRRFGS